MINPGKRLRKKKKETEDFQLMKKRATILYIYVEYLHTFITTINYDHLKIVNVNDQDTNHSQPLMAVRYL